MEYTKIELKGYKRLQLNNIQVIRIEPKHVIQLILGTNGSGKSSMLREITPLPSSHTQYEKDGYKLLELSHNGNQYQVVNRFDGKSGKYQLIRNGTEIFQGSTATDFRALIKQEFGITPEIQSLIDGVTRFSTMDVSKRRYWFTMLSRADYTYAFEYYSRLRSRIRDLQGSLNITQTRYASELSKILSEEEIVDIRSKVKSYHEIIERLLELKPRTQHIRTELEKQLIEKDQTLTILVAKIDQLRKNLNEQIVLHFPMQQISLESCQQELYRIQGTIEHVRDSETALRSKLEKLHQESETLGKTHQFSVEELHGKKAQNKQTYQRLVNTLHVQIHVESTNDFSSAFNAIYDNLDRIFEEISTIGQNERSPTRETFNSTSTHCEEIQKRFSQNNLQIQSEHRKISEMDHAKIHHQRECPACHHQWFHGYEEHRYQAIQDSLRKHLELEEQLTSELQSSQERVNDIRKIFELRDQFHQIVRSWPTLGPLWDKLDLLSDPNQNRQILNNVRIDLPIMGQIEMIAKEQSRIDELIELTQRQSNIDVDQHQAILYKAEEELVQIQERLRSEARKTRILETFIQTFKWITLYQEQLETSLEERKENLGSLSDSLRNDHFNRLIYIFRQELSILEQSISKIDIQKSLIDQYKLQIKDHERQIVSLKLAEQALSPSTGLIAKGLTGFINLFISRMNQFVKHIWIYPLEILPIEMQDEIELDYKFPVRIDDRFVAPDIKMNECNNSTAEVFDLAFRIVAMEALGLKSYPLQVDEFGASFDHKHRTVAFQVVTNLTVSTNIPQIFMVSHSEQSYGSLRNCDITVLHSDNIILPEEVEVNGATHIA